MSKLKSHNFELFMTVFAILISSRSKGVDISIRKDIIIIYKLFC